MRTTFLSYIRRLWPDFWHVPRCVLRSETYSIFLRVLWCEACIGLQRAFWINISRNFWLPFWCSYPYVFWDYIFRNFRRLSRRDCRLVSRTKACFCVWWSLGGTLQHFLCAVVWSEIFCNLRIYCRREVGLSFRVALVTQFGGSFWQTTFYIVF